MKRRHGIGIAIAFLSLVAAGQARAQIFETTVSGRTLQLPDQVKSEREGARYHWGALRLMPYLALRDVGYNNNVLGTSGSDKVGDFTATVAPGFRLLVPIGRKFVVRAGAEPAYYWWNELAYQRGWGLSGDGQVLALLNHVTLGVGGRYANTLQLVNSESNVRSRQVQSTGDAALEWEVFRRLSLFGVFQGMETRLDDSSFAVDGQPMSQLLDRNETGARAGVRYRFSSRFSIGLMEQWTTARFQQQAVARDNDGLGTLLTVRYDHARFYVDLTGGYQEGTGRYQAGGFPGYRTGTYSYFASWFVEKRVELQVQGWRRTQYSYSEGNSYYFETRNGAGLNVGIGYRITVGAFFQLGSNSYPVAVDAGTGPVLRKDDVVSVGGTLGWLLAPRTVLTVGIKSDRYTSNVPGQGRDVVTVSGGLNWSFGMLAVGAAGSAR